MVTLEQKVDLLMRWATETDFDECRRLVNEMRNILSDANATPESTTDISSSVNDAMITDIIEDLLRELGASCHLTGYEKVVCAIKFVIEDPKLLEKITYRLYPDVAKACNSTPSRVERAIRHLIETAWSRQDLQDAYRIFGNTIDINKGKPTNSEFIACCVRTVNRRMRGCV